MSTHTHAHEKGIGDSHCLFKRIKTMINNTKSLRFPKWREREREENTKKTKPQRVRDEREKEETRVSLADVSVSFFPHFKIKKLREKKKS